MAAAAAVAALVREVGISRALIWRRRGFRILGIDFLSSPRLLCLHLSTVCKGRRVLEIYSGRGVWILYGG